jgi:simple sugar transport system substrate-binding protein
LPKLKSLITILSIIGVMVTACGPGAESEKTASPTGERVESAPQVTQQVGAKVESGVGQGEPTEEPVEAIEVPVAELGPDASLELVFVQHALCAWDAFWCTVETGIQQAADDMNVNVTVLGPEQFDLQAVAQLIDQAVASHPDGIGLTMTDADLFRGPVQRALDAGIRVVVYNTGAGPEEDGVDYLTYWGQDEYQGGFLGGLRLADAGGTRGVCINHQVGHPGLDARCEGFLSAMDVSGLAGQVLAVSDDLAASQATIAEYYAENPDTDAFMTLGPNGAQPFYAFVDTAGLDPDSLFHGTFDLSDEIIARIKDGTTMYSIDQQPFLQGYGAVQTLVMVNRYGISPALSVTPTGPAFVDASTVDFQVDPDRPVELVLAQHGLCTWDPFWCVVENGIAQAAEEMDLKATVQGPDKFDLGYLAQLIDAAVAAQPDGLALTMTDAALFREPVQRALDAGIPVVAYNTGAGPLTDGVDYMTYLGQDEYQGGYRGGMRLAAAGGTRGVCINHQVGHLGLDARCDGFLAALGEQGIPARVLAITSDSAESQSLLDGYYAANPDTDIFLTLGPGGASTFYAFIDAAGLDRDALRHGTFDISGDIIARIKDGTTLFGMDQQPFLQGYGAVQALMLKVRYGVTPVLPVSPTGPGFVDASNVAIVEELAGEYR